MKMLSLLRRCRNLLCPASNAREKLKSSSKVKFMGRGSRIRACIFEGFNTLGNNVRLTDCHIGLATYINDNCTLYGTRIGNWCSIADNVRTGFGYHPMHCISTHPAFFYDTMQQLGWNIFKEGEAPEYDPYRRAETGDVVTIGHDVWIGSHVLIMDGVTIGTGAVVGAGAVVTKDVPPYAVAVGVPAKVIKYRFDDATITQLLKSEWWNRTPNEINGSTLIAKIGGVVFNNEVKTPNDDHNFT